MTSMHDEDVDSGIAAPEDGTELAADGPDAVTEPVRAHAPAPARVREESLFDDPVVKWLSIGLGVTIILFLSTVLAALYFGILGSDTPRTAQERDLQAYEFQTSQGTTDPETWRKYIAALIDSGQARRAQQAIDRGLKVINNKPGQDMTFAQALLDYENGEYEKAIDTATKGMAGIKAYHEEQLKDDQSPESKGQEFSQNYWGMLYVRANAYAELKQWDKAIADYDEYLEERGGASDVYVLRGDAKVAAGDTKGAEEDYRTALKFIEDNAQALEGLEKLGVKP